MHMEKYLQEYVLKVLKLSSRYVFIIKKFQRYYVVTNFNKTLRFGHDAPCQLSGIQIICRNNNNSSSILKRLKF